MVMQISKAVVYITYRFTHNADGSPAVGRHIARPPGPEWREGQNVAFANDQSRWHECDALAHRMAGTDPLLGPRPTHLGSHECSQQICIGLMLLDARVLAIAGEREEQRIDARVA